MKPLFEIKCILEICKRLHTASILKRLVICDSFPSNPQESMLLCCNNRKDYCTVSRQPAHGFALMLAIGVLSVNKEKVSRKK